jgi:ADP-ribose pyrophosphatase YjhB (NUDIX family)
MPSAAANVQINIVLFTLINPRRDQFIPQPADAWMQDTIDQALPELVSAQDSGLRLATITRLARPEDGNNPQIKRVLPGGVFNLGLETVADGAKRILQEDLGISGVRLFQLRIFDKPGRDPEQPNMVIPFWGIIPYQEVQRYLGGKYMVAPVTVNSRDIMTYLTTRRASVEGYRGLCAFGARDRRSERRVDSDALWGRNILALDYDDMVFAAWRRLRPLYERHPDPFELMDPYGFRMSELQEVSEVVLGEFRQRDQFRRVMLENSSWLMKSKMLDRSSPGKPATLYSLAESSPFLDIEE